MSTVAEPVLSAQEQVIASGSNVLHGKVSDRVLRIYEAIRAYGPPRVGFDRAMLFTESLKETEHQPLVLCWAKTWDLFPDRAPMHLWSRERNRLWN